MNKNNPFQEVIDQLVAETYAELATAKAKSEDNSLRRDTQIFLHELALVRYKKGMSQGELAGLVGMTQPALSRLENGRGNPTLKKLLQIAKALDVHLVVE